MVTASASTVTGKSWSPYQEDIFRDAADGDGHTVVIARAGSGKTSTITEAVKRMPRGRKLLVAFNKTIERELSARVGAQADVRTLHGFGFYLLRRALGAVSVEEDKVKTIVRDLGHVVEPSEWRALRSAVSLAKATLAQSAADVLGLIGDFDLDVPEEREATFAALVLRVLDECAARTRAVDFDDMVWLPVVLGLRPRGYDRVIVDETQDLNRCQLELALRACRSDGRLLAVGDDRQAIYGWRGADTEAIPRMVDRLRAQMLPLSVCYRCPRAVIEEAQRYVPDIEAAPGASAGRVEETDARKLRKLAQPGDIVLSRVNDPLIELCLQWLAEGRPAAIAGRDIGAGIAALVKRSEASTVEGLLTWLADWERAEIARLVEKDREPASARDRAACVRRAAVGAGNVEEVLQRLDRMFSDDGGRGRILLSSTHRAKGLEARRVWMLADTYRSFEAPGYSVEEDNLAYVAVTRAREELFFVRDDRGSR